MVALFVMVVVSGIVIGIVDTMTLQYAANRNTIAWDKARYLAEAGVQHAAVRCWRPIQPGEVASRRRSFPPAAAAPTASRRPMAPARK